jgi:hypothetical protein
MAGFTPIPVYRATRYLLLTMNEFHELVVMVLMAALAYLRTNIVGISPYAALTAEEEDGNKKTKQKDYNLLSHNFTSSYSLYW